MTIVIGWEVVYERTNGEYVVRTFDTESGARFFASSVALISTVKAESIEVREICEVII